MVVVDKIFIYRTVFFHLEAWIYLERDKDQKMEGSRNGAALDDEVKGANRRCSLSTPDLGNQPPSSFEISTPCVPLEVFPAILAIVVVVLI